MARAMNDQTLPQPGLIILFGSGETSPTGRKTFERVFRSLPPSPRIALLETPAGFELNSHQVISQVGDFFTHRLQNYAPEVQIIPARMRGTQYSPDNPEIVAPLLDADLIFMGPGSPSYAIRQLQDSLAWDYLVARHHLGAVLALASAATVAFSASALPVYEIYKVGEDLHWIQGLDFFGLYGLQLVLIPHWNNQEGGAELDTSRCFMGQERFVRLIDMLPAEMTIIGLDEKTALIMDLSRCECQVMGLGKVTLIHKDHKHHDKAHLYSSAGKLTNVTGTNDDLAKITKQRSGHFHEYLHGQYFPMSEIGNYQPLIPEATLPTAVWQKAIYSKHFMEREGPLTPTNEVAQLIRARQEARKASNWAIADELRIQIEKSGWEVLDTKEGPVSRKLPKLKNNN